MVEGPGHIPFDQIQRNMEREQERCDHAPFYVLGPVVTDVAPGYDHITSSIGATAAAFYGASLLCYVTPAEHLALPDAAQVREGVIAARIAAHAGDVAKGVRGAAEADRHMSELRRHRDWEGQIKMALDPVHAENIRVHAKSGSDDACSMCGEFCVFKIADLDAAGL